jgi:hypothetical protein
MVVPSMSTAKNAVARTFSCDIAVKTAASMTFQSGVGDEIDDEVDDGGDGHGA